MIKCGCVHSIVGVILGSVVVVMLFAPAQAATVTDRYEAIMSVCAAMKAAGTLTAQQEALCRRLRAARTKRDSGEVLELLAEAEIAFKPVDPDRIIFNEGEGSADGDSASAKAGFASNLKIVEIDSDVHVFDLALLDDMAVYEKLLGFESRPLIALVAPRPRPRSSANLHIVPPEGWVEFENDALRFRKIAKMANREPVMLRPGISIDREDFREWILAEERARRGSADAMYFVGSDVAFLLPCLNSAKTLYLQPDFTASEQTLTRVLRLLSVVKSDSFILVLPHTFPGLDILKAAFDGMKQPITISDFPASNLAIFSSPGRTIVSNDGNVPRLVDMSTWSRSSGDTSDYASYSRVDVTTLYSDLAVESFRAGTTLEVPAKAVMFVNIASKYEGD